METDKMHAMCRELQGRCGFVGQRLETSLHFITSSSNSKADVQILFCDIKYISNNPLCFNVKGW